MIVLSLFDGMSCGRVALDKLGIIPTKYFSSEIDKHCLKVQTDNYKDIIQIGDITSLEYREGVLIKNGIELYEGKIDLVLGGSPCQGFSLAGKGLAFDDSRSALYFKFESLLLSILEYNPECKFLLENTRMKKEYREVISSRLKVQPVSINSALVSAQNRPRLYWSNILITVPDNKNILLQDILEEEVQDKFYITGGRLSWLENYGVIKEQKGYVSFNPKKAKCLTVRSEPSWNTTYIIQRPHGYNPGGLKSLDGKTPTLTTSSWEHNNLLLDKDNKVRKLTPIECERLQTLPDNYTKSVSDSQRYKMLGNGWTVDVIVHILQELKNK